MSEKEDGQEARHNIVFDMDLVEGRLSHKCKKHIEYLIGDDPLAAADMLADIMGQLNDLYEESLKALHSAFEQQVKEAKQKKKPH